MKKYKYQIGDTVYVTDAEAEMFQDIGSEPLEVQAHGWDDGQPTYRLSRYGEFYEHELHNKPTPTNIQ